MRGGVNGLCGSLVRRKGKVSSLSDNFLLLSSLPFHFPHSNLIISPFYSSMPHNFSTMASSDSYLSRLSSSFSRRYHSKSDLFEENDVEEDLKAEYLCPFCAEDFDVVGLCCHIDEEHPVEAKNGVCPICGKRVGMNIVGHITRQHGNFFKVQRKRRLRKGGSNSALSFLRRELREGSLQSLHGGSAFVSSSNIEADPLLSTFIFNPPALDESLGTQPTPAETSLDKIDAKEEASDSDAKLQHSLISEEDQAERSLRSMFVQGLVLSTILGYEL